RSEIPEQRRALRIHPAAKGVGGIARHCRSQYLWLRPCRHFAPLLSPNRSAPLPSRSRSLECWLLLFARKLNQQRSRLETGIREQVALYNSRQEINLASIVSGGDTHPHQQVSESWIVADRIPDGFVFNEAGVRSGVEATFERAQGLLPVVQARINSGDPLRLVQTCA